MKKTLVLHLASNRYIEARVDVIFLVPPATDKTHLAIALGVKACQAGYHVRFCSAVDLVQELVEARTRTSATSSARFRSNRTRRPIIDRLIHHAEIIALKGSSYRTRGKEQAIPSVVSPTQESH